TRRSKSWPRLPPPGGPGAFSSRQRSNRRTPGGRRRGRRTGRRSRSSTKGCSCAERRPARESDRPRRSLGPGTRRPASRRSSRSRRTRSSPISRTGPSRLTCSNVSAAPIKRGRPTPERSVSPKTRPCANFSPRNRASEAAARRLLGEDFLEKRGDARGRVRPDLSLLVADHEEEAVEGLADHVAIEVDALGFQERDRLGLAEELVVLLDGADLVHRPIDDRPEGQGERRGGLVLEVVGRG